MIEAAALAIAGCAMFVAALNTADIGRMRKELNELKRRNQR